MKVGALPPAVLTYGGTRRELKQQLVIPHFELLILCAEGKSC